MLNQKLLIVAAFAWAGVLGAQEQTRLVGPTTGFVYDGPSRSIRVVMGVPGAAYLGRAIASDLDVGAVSPDGTKAVAARGGEIVLIDQAAFISRLDAGQAERIVWNDSSNAVAVLSAGSIRMYRLGGDGGGSRVPLAEFRAGGRAVTLDSDAVYAASEGGIYRIDSESAKLLAPAGDVSAMALVSGTLYVADKASHQILAIRNLGGSAEVRLALGAAQGIEEPVALGASRDGSRLYVAEKARTLSAFNPGTGEMLTRLELDFDATRVDAMGGPVFLLRSRQANDDTVQVMDERQMAVYFVPAQDLASVASLED